MGSQSNGKKATETHSNLIISMLDPGLAKWSQACLKSSGKQEKEQGSDTRLSNLLVAQRNVLNNACWIELTWLKVWPHCLV